MPDHTSIYKEKVKQYERMISKQPSLLKVIQEITAINEKDIIELGAGTGRLTCILAPYAKSILALDSSPEMLGILDKKLKKENVVNYKTTVADHRNIPANKESADIIIAGWSICYLGSSNIDDYVGNIDKIMEESMRVLRANGTIIFFETMGTGTETPNPPEFLKDYYSILEHKYGFSHKWIRLDYHFDNIHQADELTRFFFGDELADKVVKEQIITLPECAGVWWLTKSTR